MGGFVTGGLALVVPPAVVVARMALATPEAPPVSSVPACARYVAEHRRTGTGFATNPRLSTACRDLDQVDYARALVLEARSAR